jgi:ribose/xylose/arabinose/galactoside ABC-type transport system permease subunit
MPYRTGILSILLLILLVASTFVAAKPSVSAAGLIVRGWVSYGLPLIPLSCAAGLIISCGQIDIFSGAAFSLTGMFVVAWMVASAPATGFMILWGCFLAWGIVIAFYALMYVVVVFLRVPALLCTLGLAFCGQSFSLFLSSSIQGVGRYRWHMRMAGIASQTVPVDGPVRVLGWSLIWVPIVIILLIWWRYFSRAGLGHIAVGMDLEAAAIAGVKTKWIYLVAFMMSGILVGLSALLSLMGVYRGGWVPTNGWGNELLAIAAAVLGGCRIAGGRFDPSCVALATLLIFAIRDTVHAFLLPVELGPVVLGVLLILVALADSFERLRMRAALRPGVPI